MPSSFVGYSRLLYIKVTPACFKPGHIGLNLKVILLLTGFPGPVSDLRSLCYHSRTQEGTVKPLFVNGLMSVNGFK